MPKPPIRDPRTGRYQPQSTGVPERTLWSYIIQVSGERAQAVSGDGLTSCSFFFYSQIANAIRAVHVAGFAVRTVDPSKILVTGPNRCDPSLQTLDAPADSRKREQGTTERLQRARRLDLGRRSAASGATARRPLGLWQDHLRPRLPVAQRHPQPRQGGRHAREGLFAGPARGRGLLIAAGRSGQDDSGVDGEALGALVGRADFVFQVGLLGPLSLDLKLTIVH